MYKDFIGKKVTVIITTYGDNLLEYNGYLMNEDDDNLILSNVDMGLVMYKVQRSVFGSGISEYKQSVPKATVNKKYIVTCILNEE